MQKKQIETQKKTGFTLIEILVVIGLIAILATIVIIAINPARQFAQGRNTQRTSNVNAILNGIGQYIADNKGNLPTQISGLVINTPTPISTAGSNLCDVLVSTYLPSMVVDPNQDPDHIGAVDGPLAQGEAIPKASCSLAYTTAYTVARDATNRVTVCAPVGATTDVAYEAALDPDGAGPLLSPATCVTR